MSADASALFVPGHGTLFIAPENTPLPDNPLSVFSLSGTPPTGWANIGHTSKDNTPAFKRDGGDATAMDTWLADSVRTIYAATSWSLTINPLQIEKDILDLGFGGWMADNGGYVIPSVLAGKDSGLFLLSQDGGGKLGFYMPATSINLGGDPGFDPSKFFEIVLTASIHAADPAAIPLGPNGETGIIQIFKDTLTATPAA